MIRTIEDINGVAHADLQCPEMSTPNRYLELTKAVKFDDVDLCDCVQEVEE